VSESAHIRNLLQKSGTPIPQGNTAVTRPGPIRFGVKGAAIQIIDSLCEMSEELFSPTSEKKFLVKYTFYADSSESVFHSNVETIEEDLPKFTGDFFESFPDLFISIFASNDHVFGYPPPSPDAVYMHTGDDHGDMGEIILHVYLPKEIPDALEYMRANMLEIAGTLSHEMQHVVQKHCYGEALSPMSGDTLLAHAFDRNEVDARVEEVITNMGVDMPEDDEELFLSTLNVCIDAYLSRNSSELEDMPHGARDKMITEHTVVYKNKMRDVL
jgi:hypothetical protein